MRIATSLEAAAAASAGHTATAPSAARPRPLSAAERRTGCGAAWLERVTNGAVDVEIVQTQGSVVAGHHETMNGWKVFLAWLTLTGTSTAIGAGQLPGKRSRPRRMPRLHGDDLGGGRQGLRRQVDRLPVVDAKPGLLQRDGGGEELRGISDRVAELEVGESPGGGAERRFQEVRVLMLLFADDLGELMRLAGEMCAAQRLGIKRGLEALDQQPEGEDLLVGGGRPVRIRRRSELGGADGGAGERADPQSIP